MRFTLGRRRRPLDVTAHERRRPNVNLIDRMR
jgi:hypothetical protein